MTGQNTQEDAKGREKYKDTNKDKWIRNFAEKFPWLGTLSYSVDAKLQKESNCVHAFWWREWK